MVKSIEDFSDEKYAKIREITNRRDISDILHTLGKLNLLRTDLYSVFEKIGKKRPDLKDILNKLKTLLDDTLSTLDMTTTKMLTQIRKEDK